MTFGTLEVYNLINLRNISNMNIEKFCLKWNEFDENIRHSFQALGHQQNLFDVTLATDDGHKIEAHRVILSSRNDFFSDVLSKCTRTNMLVYLKGIAKSNPENIIDCLYNGETFVTQDELNLFLLTAQELKVKGLQTVDDKTNNTLTEPNIEEPKFTNQSLISTREAESYLSPQQNKKNEIILVNDTESTRLG